MEGVTVASRLHEDQRDLLECSVKWPPMSTALMWNDVEMLKARLPAHVVFRAMATETVLLNIETGQYYAVDAVGGRFLEMLNSADSLGDAASRLAAEYEQPDERIQEDLIAFLEALRQRGLVELA